MRISVHAPIVTLLVGMTVAVYAQRPPAIHGVTGTMATDATIKQEHAVAKKIAVAAEDGVQHLFPAGKGPLSDLKPGSTVAVYTESKVTEGTVSDVKVRDNEITIRYPGGTKETLTLADKASADPSRAVRNGAKGTTRIVVYYSDDARERIARYFTPKS